MSIVNYCEHYVVSFYRYIRFHNHSKRLFGFLCTNPKKMSLVQVLSGHFQFWNHVSRFFHLGLFQNVPLVNDPVN